MRLPSLRRPGSDRLDLSCGCRTSTSCSLLCLVSTLIRLRLMTPNDTMFGPVTVRGAAHLPSIPNTVVGMNGSKERERIRRDLDIQGRSDTTECASLNVIWEDADVVGSIMDPDQWHNSPKICSTQDAASMWLSPYNVDRSSESSGSRERHCQMTSMSEQVLHRQVGECRGP